LAYRNRWRAFPSRRNRGLNAICRPSALIVAAQVREADELPERLLLLAIPLDQPVKGIISVAGLAAYHRERFAEYLGRIGSDTISAVKNALAARFGLDV
jgi:hypothetical protein